MDEVGSAATSLVIRGEDADDAAVFANVTNNVSSRATTDAAAAWNPAAWTTVGEAGLAQRTSDLSAIVQEIVARPGWLAGNDVAFVITGSGTRTAEAFESSAAKAPLLHIEYVLPSSIAEPVVGNISINDVTITEGDAGAKTATFTVSRTGTAAFTVDFATANGTANAGSDYVTNSDTLSFAAGESTKTVLVTISGDTTVEDNETFFLDLTNATAGIIVDGQGLGTITNDDGAPRTFEKRVASGLDDVEQQASGKMSMSSSDIELVDDAGSSSGIGQRVGLRFTNIDLPQGATITKAYIQFYADEAGSTATSLVIRGEDADDAAAFASVNHNVSSRLTTDAAAAWNPAAWTTIGEAGLAQRTSDLSAIMQEIVARPGWLAGNDVAFVITGSGTRTAEAFESSAAKAPLLHVEYVLPTSDAAPVVGNISISDVTLTEGDAGAKTATFTVSRTGTAAFAVGFATANGTATAGVDYVASAGTLTFAA
ncbi:MAG TPA: Calx-beta domain-containing protein, partial [Hyphomicrobiaceae bacterium]|nr:Calx-beta domain-containing protein [Hyphomicrobiaceae bacterium]